MATAFTHTSYESTDAALARLGCDISAAEGHGMLCGLLCSPMAFDREAWFQHLIGYDEDLSLGALDLNHPLHVLIRETQAGLTSQDFDFALLLPDDETDLSERAACLGEWCQGFISGFGLAGPSVIEELSDDARDFLEDLRQICALDYDDVESAGDETAFFELAEFTRIGALMVREETRFDPDSTQAREPTLH